MKARALEIILVLGAVVGVAHFATAAPCNNRCAASVPGDTIICDDAPYPVLCFDGENYVGIANCKSCAVHLDTHRDECGNASTVEGKCCDDLACEKICSRPICVVSGSYPNYTLSCSYSGVACDWLDPWSYIVGDCKTCTGTTCPADSTPPVSGQGTCSG